MTHPSLRATALLLALAVFAPLHAAEVIDDGASVTVPGSQSSPWAVSGDLTVGDIGAGSLAIGAGGSVTSTNGFIGYSAGSVGTVNVSGADALWSINPPSGLIGTNGLYIGYSGHGTLNISDGGKVQITGSSAHLGYNVAGDENASGSLVVSGPGSVFSVSALLSVGRIGQGSLTISGGGTVSTQTALVGQAAGTDQLPGVGTVLVTGAGSAWNTLGFTTNTDGSSVRIENGAAINSTNAVTLKAGDTVVTGAGSTLAGGGNFYVSSSLLVENGGQLVTTSTGSTANSVGYDSGVTASVRITGTGSAWTSAADITVSRTGAGSNSALTIADGGKVTVNGGNGNIRLAGGNNTTGTLNIGEGGAAGILEAAEVTAGSTSSTRTAQVNFNHTGTTPFSAALTGARLGVTKLGSGTTILTGANTYALATAVNEGALLVNGSLGVTVVTVASGATFGGTGIHTGTTTFQSGSFLAAGSDGVGAFTTGSASFAGGSTYLWEIADASGVAGEGWDLLNVAGALTLDATAENAFILALATVGELAGFDAAQDYDFVVASSAGGISGFDPAAIALDLSGFGAAYTGSWSLGLSESGDDLVVSYTAVPEPSTYAVLFGGVALAAGLRYRRRRQR
jgi:fibronectin-binding autotransporter adhesin